MRSFSNINILIVLLLALAAGAALNLQATLTVLDRMYANISWFLEHLAASL